MKPEQVFKIANIAVMPAWLLMLFAPKATITAQIMNSHVFSFGLALFYVFYVGKSFGKIKVDFTTLGGIAKLFTNKEALLAGWIHYLIFDLFVGTWEWRDALQNGYSHWVLVLCLPFTLMLGPVGLLLYLSLKIFIL
jgi:hypothetical protein